MPAISTPDLIRVFGRIGLLSFGGPAAQIALMQRELVEERGWLDQAEFLRALSFCMLLPGPEAMQLATYAGWRLRGTMGGLIAGLLFVLPGAMVIFALALAYASYGQLAVVQALFLGIKAAVVVIVLMALRGLARRALRGREDVALALASFLAIFALQLPFPAIIAAAAFWGLWRGRQAADGARAAAPPSGAVPLRQTLSTAGLWLTLWLVPLALLIGFEGGVLADLALFFSTLAIVTFGGAYAVLSYMTQTVVTDFGWLTTAQMIDALGLAETTPGPLILVTQFVGILAGIAQGGAALGIAAGIVALWMTFTPCFLWIFTGAPYIDALAHRPRLRGALASITAAVVGVILNLSLWFALHVLFARVTSTRLGPLPDWSSFQWQPALLAALALLVQLRLALPLPVFLAVMALAGYAISLVPV
ncbi:chromate efflux transporter [Seohaeicola saemankumensis]|uniref:Chromate efflux transporter n=1 Tax=Seohaeicola saemankumensis TaxID=481181 RepID=A0ABW3TII4_9RHOB